MPNPRKVALLGLVLVPFLAGGFVVHSRKLVTAHAFSTRSSRSFPEGSSIASVPPPFTRAARGLVRELNDPYSVLRHQRSSRLSMLRPAAAMAGSAWRSAKSRFRDCEARLPAHTRRAGGVMKATHHRHRYGERAWGTTAQDQMLERNTGHEGVGEIHPPVLPSPFR